ncbi:uncharacterized protein At4g19900-like [Vicia villosa]|uniref:uncharacterized protein At4g19900-like n=1 Tax=Vicia villosa TaxID=3911 RepID=UPI00273CD7C3|nr:uncharacterized protein At4g19900-like [Vicia villosa]
MEDHIKHHHHHLFHKLHNFLHNFKKSLFSILFILPTPFLALLILFLLAYNAFSIFTFHIPHHDHSSHKHLLLPPPSHTKIKLSSSVFFARNEEHSSPIINKGDKKHKHVLNTLPCETSFEKRLDEFFTPKSFSSSSCKVRFFMTWISPLKSFGEREFLSIESLFKSHPKACLVIVSKSMDSKKGAQILKPFTKNGFKVIAIEPDFNYIFKNTHAESWFNRLKQGNVNPGEISLGQNLSNLLRLSLLYKYGGIYIDADVMILKSFSNLRNTIGAQNIDAKTKKWSRLNNAVLIFDKNHPLLLKFIEEFALTFDGNKWGHNGPYLISRVVSRVSGREGFNFSIVPPSAFYPVDWRGIKSLFKGPKDHEVHSKWLVKKMKQIREESFALHFWNRQSRNLKVVKGSVIDSIISSCCIFCKN